MRETMKVNSNQYSEFPIYMTEQGKVVHVLN